MKSLNILCAAFLILFWSATSMAQKTLPASLTMETMAGQKINLKDYVAKQGKITVINFWATWCKPCKEELDLINSDYLDDWKDEYDIEFIAVSMDDTRTKARVKGIVDSKGWEYTIFCNPDNSAYQALGFNACPYTILLDEEGNIIYSHSSYTPGDEEELEEKIIAAAQ